MSASTVNIKVIVAAGVKPPDAIKVALPGRVAEFARKYGFKQSNVSRCMYGLQFHDSIRAALAKELGVDRPWLDALLDGRAA